VESAKIETRALTAAYEQTGKLAERKPVLVDGGINVYASEDYFARLKARAPVGTLVEILREHFNMFYVSDNGWRSAGGAPSDHWIKANEDRLRPYFAVLAFLPMFPEYEAAIQKFRHKVRDQKRVATCLGFGPRFLHSTGQDYKGGPNTGVFLQITADHAVDVKIPGQRLSFGVVIDAQAAGDLAVMESRGRRAVRVHLGADVAAGLNTLAAAIDEALA